MPIIDRSLPSERHVRAGNHSSKAFVFPMILVAVLILGAIAGLMVQVANDGESHSPETPVRNPAGILYTTHSPILIVGNGGFTIANGVLGGSGTASDPFIIANWDINASAADGISIRDTDAHFIVRNCYVHDGWVGVFYIIHCGIALSNCVNGNLENNNCSNDYSGIVLDSSSHSNILSNNTCSSNHYEGIDLYSSSNNTLINNTCSSNRYDGIDLHSSSNQNTIVNNSFSSNYQVGMYVSSSNGNIIMNNTCSLNYGGIEVSSSSGNALSNNNCSSNDHWGVFLSASSSNTLSNNNCSSDADEGIALSSSNNNALRNNNCSNGDIGVYLYSSSNNTLSGNTCNLNSHEGIYLYSSSNSNQVYRNLVSKNSVYGLITSSVSNNRLWNNTLFDNNGATDTYDASHVQARDDGTYNSWNGTDGYGNWWSDWQSPDNVPPYGIVDLPYNISGSAGAKDNYPLTLAVPIPEFGMMPLVVMVLMIMIVLAGRTRRRKKG